MSRRPRSMKIQEFYAHSGTINSVSIGRKSSGVIATGADDQLVNIWKLGKTKPLMSLAGHTTEVDCVLFDVHEAWVAAGSRGGTIKVWDLSQEKLVRTLPGHRASVSCLDFHPYGDYFASGSGDCNVKIFDVRKKGCMQTYKGHAAQLTAVRHSPDGRWIVSGDANGVLKVWDLTSGKLIHEFKLNARERVVALDFHPHEFLMAVSGEHSTTFWDMESFAILSTTPKESAALRCARFSACGRALFASSGDHLKTWSWEPEAQLEDMLEVGWGAGGVGGGALASGQVLCDIAEGPAGTNELIGVTRMKTVLGIYVCDLSTLKPFDQPMDEHADTGANMSQSLMQTMEPVSLDSQQPLPPMVVQADLPPPSYDSLTSPTAADAAASSSSSSAAPRSILDAPSKNFFDAHAAHANANGVHVVMPSKPSPFTKPTAAEMQQSRPTTQASKFQPSLAAAAAAVDQSTSMSRRDPTPLNVAAALPPTAIASQLPPANSPSSSATPAAAAAPAPAAAASAAPTIDLATHRKKVVDDHKALVSILSGRARSLKSLQTHWLAGNPKRCIDELVKLNDPAVVVDFLSATESAFTTGSLLTLDMARDLLPLCKTLLTRGFESYATIGLKYIKLLLINFTPVVQSCRSSAPSSGVDLTRDERVARANDCFVLFKAIYDQSIASIAKRQSPVGELARDTRTHLEKLLWTK